MLAGAAEHAGHYFAAGQADIDAAGHRVVGLRAAFLLQVAPQLNARWTKGTY